MKNLKLNVLLALALACGSAQGSMGGLIFAKFGLPISVKKISLFNKKIKDSMKDFNNANFVNFSGDFKDLDEDEFLSFPNASFGIGLSLGALGFININDSFGIGAVLEAGGNFTVLDAVKSLTGFSSSEQFFAKLGIALRYEGLVISGGVRFSYKNVGLDLAKLKERNTDGILTLYKDSDKGDLSELKPEAGNSSSFAPGWFAEIMFFLPITEQLKGFFSFEMFGDCQANEAKDFIKGKWNLNGTIEDVAVTGKVSQLAAKFSVGIAYAFGSTTSIGMPKDSVEEMRETRLSVPK